MMGDFAMSSLVDNIILMNFIELGDTFRHGLTVAKMRSNPVKRVTHECEVIDGKGMRVLPRRCSKRAQAAFSSYTDYFTSPGPDRLRIAMARGAEEKADSRTRICADRAVEPAREVDEATGLTGNFDAVGNRCDLLHLTPLLALFANTV